MTEELKRLKEEAKELGLNISGNIGIETLKEKIESFKDNKPVKVKSEKDIISEKRKEIRELVRVRISNVDPQDANLPGVVKTFTNAKLGTVRRHIPFNSDFYKNGYHIEKCIYDILKNEKYNRAVQKTNSQTKQTFTVLDAFPKYSIEVLEPLNKEELEKLSKDQKARLSID